MKMQKMTRRNFLKTTAALSALPLVASASEGAKQESLKFIHVTDSHMDLDVQKSVDAIKRMVSFINKEYQELDFVLFGGDNYNNNIEGGKDSEVFKSLVSKLHCPYYLVRGNKESSPLGDGYGVGFDTYKSLFYKQEGMKVVGNDWVIEKKGFQILGLDSCIDGHNNGMYTEETMKFAEGMMANKKPTLILNHHPYTNYWGGTEEKDLHKYVLGNTKEVLKRLFSNENLLLTLSGHKHIDSVTQIQGTKVIVTRGFIRPLDEHQYPMRYIELSGKEILEKLIYTA